MAVRLLAQNREILANRIPINSAAGNLVHALICYTRRSAPVYSDLTAECELLEHLASAGWPAIVRGGSARLNCINSRDTEFAGSGAINVGLGLISIQRSRCRQLDR